eukprot:1598528-Rhodomonas_salina.3
MTLPAESAGSVWRKVNGTDREWFEDVPKPAPGVPWVWSQKELKAQHLRPYKLKAPPPCAPGYGGAFCKIELGTGGDYVDEVASRLWSYAFASDARAYALAMCSTAQHRAYARAISSTEHSTFLLPTPVLSARMELPGGPAPALGADGRRDEIKGFLEGAARLKYRGTRVRAAVGPWRVHSRDCLGQGLEGGRLQVCTGQSVVLEG